jgi:hypothetical protein
MYRKARMCFNILETSTFHSSARAYPTNTSWRLHLLQRRRTHYYEWTGAFPSLLESCMCQLLSCNHGHSRAERVRGGRVGCCTSDRKQENLATVTRPFTAARAYTSKVAIGHDAFAGSKEPHVKCMCTHKCAQEPMFVREDSLSEKQIQYAPLFSPTPFEEAGAAHPPMSPSCPGPGRTHENVNSQAPSHVPRPQPFSRTSLNR